MLTRALMLSMLIGAAPLFAQDASSFQTLWPESSEMQPWNDQVVPATAPERGGQQVTALQWPVGKVPSIDSPPLLSSWDTVDELRFWIFLDKAYPFSLDVLLTGSSGGYFNAAVNLSKAGWQEVNLPIKDFRPAHQPVLSQCQRLGFRAQGYGQPRLDAGVVWWIGKISVHPKPGSSFAPLKFEGNLADQLARWKQLATTGNPLQQALVLKFKTPVSPFVPPSQPVTNTWQYRSIVNDALPIAYLACDPDSPYHGRKDLTDHAMAVVDWLLNASSASGTWWTPGHGIGDANVNRFTLSPLMDMVRWLKMLPEGKEAWPRWKSRLQVAVDYERKDYAVNGGHYPNQDVFFVVISQLASELFSTPKDAEAARAAVKKLRESLLPEGGLNYIGHENEAPIYHSLDVLMLARYLTLSGDPAAKSLIQATQGYWPLTLTADGRPESWSEPWWKHYWIPVPAESLVVVTGLTRDPKNAWYLDRLLERKPFEQVNADSVYALPYWTTVANLEAPPLSFLTADENIRGFHGRQDNWYFGFTQGRGLRDTFVGGLITNPAKVDTLSAMFRGAQIEVSQKPKEKHGLWLSQQEDVTATAQAGDWAALGVQYTLQRSLINGWPPPQTPPSAWRVTQIWRVGPDGILGSVTLEATQAAMAEAIIGRIALGPGPVREEGICGPLQVHFFKTIAAPRVAPIAEFVPRPGGEWEGLEMNLPIHRLVQPGEKFEYLVWLGPQASRPPEKVRRTLTGWTAEWSDGSSEETSFNPTTRHLTFTRHRPLH